MENEMSYLEKLLEKYKRYEMPELIQTLKQEQKEEMLYENIQKIIEKANGYDMVGILRALVNTEKGKEYYLAHIPFFTSYIKKEGMIPYIDFMIETFPNQKEVVMQEIREELFASCMSNEIPQYIAKIGMTRQEENVIIEKCSENQIPELVEALYHIGRAEYVRKNSAELIEKCNPFIIIELAQKWQAVDEELWEEVYVDLMKKCQARKLPEFIKNTNHKALVETHKAEILEQMDVQYVPAIYQALIEKGIELTNQDYLQMMQKTAGEKIPFMVKHMQKENAAIIKDNMAQIIQYCGESSIETLVQVLKERSDAEEILANHFTEIIERASADTVIHCLERVQDYSKVHEIMQTRNDDFILELMDSIPQSEIDEEFFGELIKNEKGELLKAVFEQFIEERDKGIGKDFSQYVSFIDNGKNSYVFRVKDYAVKIGKPRKTYEIPYDEHIRQPLFRMQDTDKQGKNVILTVEVQRYTVNRKMPTKEEREELARKLKERGIIAKDLVNHAENAFYLDKGDDNRMVIPKEDKSGGIIHYPDEKPDEGMQGGDVVLNDTDYVWKEEER